MAFTASRPVAVAALPDTDQDPLRPVMCPMCHTPSTLSQGEVEAGADWRCIRCTQHWDAPRLAAVAAYAAWQVEHERAQASSQATRPTPSALPFKART